MTSFLSIAYACLTGISLHKQEAGNILPLAIIFRLFLHEIGRLLLHLSHIFFQSCKLVPVAVLFIFVLFIQLVDNALNRLHFLIDLIVGIGLSISIPAKEVR